MKNRNNNNNNSSSSSSSNGRQDNNRNTGQQKRRQNFFTTCADSNVGEAQASFPTTIFSPSDMGFLQQDTYTRLNDVRVIQDILEEVFQILQTTTGDYTPSNNHDDGEAAATGNNQ